MLKIRLQIHCLMKYIDDYIIKKKEIIINKCKKKNVFTEYSRREKIMKKYTSSCALQQYCTYEF